MTNRRREDDSNDPSFEGVTDFTTVPPPAGTGDVHNARTAVAHLPDSFLDELRSAKQNDATSTRRAKKFELPGGFGSDEPATRPGAQNALLQQSMQDAGSSAKIDNLVSRVNAALAQAAPRDEDDAHASLAHDGDGRDGAAHDAHARVSEPASLPGSPGTPALGAHADVAEHVSPELSPPSAAPRAARGRAGSIVFALIAFLCMFALAAWALFRYGHLLQR